MKNVVLILAATLLVYTVAYCLGALLLRGLRLSLYRSEERFFSFVAGSACLSTVIFLATAAGLARQQVFLALSLAVLAAGLWRRVYRSAAEDMPPAPAIWRVLFWTGFAAFTCLYASQALAPESSPDGMAYHIALPARYLREHHFPRILTDVRAGFPQGMEMLFEYAYSIGRHSAAAMAEFLFLLALPFGMLAYTRRIGRPRAGVAAALLVYASPIAGRAGTAAYVDVAAATVALALFYVLQIWLDRREAGLPLLAGLLAGFGFAIKYTGIAGVLYALGFLGITALRRRPLSWKPAAIGALCAFAIVAPWLIKNAVILKNPVSPFLNGVFPNPYVHARFEQELSRAYGSMNGVTMAEIPMELAVRGQRLSGLIGPMFLLAPVGLLALRWSAGRQILLAAAVFGLPYFANIGARFSLPALPFLALGLALALDRIQWLAALLASAHLIVCWPPVVSQYAAKGAWHIQRPVWNAALRRIPEAEYLRAMVDTYEMSRLLDQWVAPRDLIFALSMDASAYHSRQLILPWGSALGDRMREVLARAADPDLQPVRRYALSMPELEARRVRLVQIRAGGEALVLHEIRVYRGAAEVERNVAWRVRAWPNPWEVQAAFDARPWTFWSDWESGRPGAYLQIEFGGPERFDRVELDVARSARVDLAVQAEAGRDSWRTLPATASLAELPCPPQLRRRAMEELKANGIGWLISRDGELLHANLAGWWGQWGITEVARSRGYHLWRVE